MTFQQRLVKAKREGNLTDADLARWFDRAGATVRCWVHDGINPGGGEMDRISVSNALILLELRIRKKQGFPVPRMAPKARIQYLAKLKNGAR